jgi:hypothetical protein
MKAAVVENQTGDDLLELPPPSRKHQRWTLLMVGDSGRVFRIRRVRGWLSLLVALPVISLAMVTGGYLRSERQPAVNRTASGQVNRLQEEVRALRQENSRLVRRIATGQSQAGIQTTEGSPDRPRPVTPAAAIPQDDETSTAPPSTEAANPQIVESVLNAPDAPAVARQSDETVSPSTVVTAKDMTINLDPVSRTAQVQFKIVNLQSYQEPFKGYAFVVLKGADRADDSWLVFPEADFGPKGPVAFDSGFDFNISNYMFIKFKPRQAGSLLSFHTATVMVYDATGRLVLDTDFDLTHTE